MFAPDYLFCILHSSKHLKLFQCMEVGKVSGKRLTLKDRENGF
jgi:hypothetical protein